MQQNKSDISSANHYSYSESEFCQKYESIEVRLKEYHIISECRDKSNTAILCKNRSNIAAICGGKTQAAACNGRDEPDGSGKQASF